ncbi:hypothetical protein NRB20_61790 [Nocardia sp. RB20]|uniref:Uncharacterized protein n=1 Tax=Nocardia macrotermitis TaxID=2585198 RepID=A0A7K0DCK5_9NOCA|nr:hypothetical protein [Nocardia macrotermitis]
MLVVLQYQIANAPIIGLPVVGVSCFRGWSL